MRCAWTALFLIGLLVAVMLPAGMGRATPAQTTPPLPFKPVGQLGGASRALAIRPPFAYLGVGPQVEVLDITQPSAPLPLGASDLLDGTITDLRLDGDRLYAAVLRNTDSRLVVFDVTQPAAPRVWGDLTVQGAVVRLAVVGATVFAAAGGQGLHVVDVTGPPRLVTSYRTQTAAYDVDVAGAYAFVTLEQVDYRTGRETVRGEGIEVLDVTDPGRPVPVGILNQDLEREPGPLYQIELSGNLAYCVTSGELAILDLSDVASPRLLGRAKLPGSASAVSAWGGTAFHVTDGYAVMTVLPGSRQALAFDVADPTAPRLVAQSNVYPDDWWQAAAVAYPYALLASTRGGYQALDLTSSAAKDPTWAYPVPASVFDVVTDGELAFAAASTSGLLVVDVADPASPRILATLPISGTAIAVRRLGQTVYAGVWGVLDAKGQPTFQGQVIAVDVSDPSRPVRTATLPLDGSVAGLDLDGRFLYAVGPRLDVFDLAVPAQPRPVSHLDLDPAGWFVRVANGVAHISGSGAELRLVDVADPVHLRQVGAHPTDAAVVGLDLFGKYAMLRLRDSEQVEIVDVGRPDQPSRVSLVPQAGFGIGLEVQDDTVWLPRYGGLAAYDASDPTRPSRVADVDWAPGGPAVTADDGHVYTYGYEYGLSIWTVERSAVRRPLWFPVVTRP